MLHSCCFIGHRQCTEDIKGALRKAIEKMITDYNVCTFYVGTQGAFDRMVYAVLAELEKCYDIRTVVVLAYLNSPSCEEVYYDYEKTIFPDVLATTPPRFAIRRRNAFMMKSAAHMIAYVNTRPSNAYLHFAEAVAKKKHVINIGKLSE